MTITTNSFKDNFRLYYRPLCLFALHYLHDIGQFPSVLPSAMPFRIALSPRYRQCGGHSTGLFCRALGTERLRNGDF